MRTKIVKWLVAILTALGLTAAAGIIGSVPAQAATDITVGDSCYMSANWPTWESANFNNTSGSPSRGYLDYVVVRSNGALKSVSANWYGPAGEPLGGTSNFHLQARASGDPYIYRADPNAYGIGKVTVNPEAPSGLRCSDYSGSAVMYSRN